MNHSALPGPDRSPAMSWVKTLAATLTTTALAVVGLFFAAFALAAAATILTVLIGRLWWLRRTRGRTATANEPAVVEGEYRVIDR